MNRIVRAWNKSVARHNSNVPDAITIEDEKIPLTEGKSKSGGKTMVQELRKVSINKGVVQELAVHGPQDRVEALFRETHRTLKRLGVDASGAKPLGKSPRYEGGRPGVHDIVRWLDDLRVPGATEGAEVTKELKKDLKWVQRLHVTLRNRAHTNVVEEVEAS